MDLGLCVQKLKVLSEALHNSFFKLESFFPSTQYSFGFKAKWQSSIGRDELHPALYNRFWNRNYEKRWGELETASVDNSFKDFCNKG